MSDLIIYENLPSTVDSLIIDNKEIDIFKMILDSDAKNLLYLTIIKCYNLRKLKVDQKAIKQDTVLLYEQIMNSEKLVKWSINHICLALEQGSMFAVKDVDNLNTISVAKLFNWIKSFSEYRAKVLIIDERKKEKVINEQLAKEKEPEKRRKYLNDICHFFNSKDWKDCDNVGMHHIYFTTFIKTFEDKPEYIKRLKELKQEAENNCEIKEDASILKINPKDYFINSATLKKFFSNLERNNIKLEVSNDLKIMLTR